MRSTNKLILGIILAVIGVILAIFAIKAMNQRPMQQYQRASYGSRCSGYNYNDNYYDNSGYRNRGDMSNQMSMSKDRFGNMSSNVMHGRATRHEAQVVWTLVGGIILFVLGLIIIIASRMGMHHRRHHTTAHHHTRKSRPKRRKKGIPGL